MAALQRHQLVWLDAGAWQRVLTERTEMPSWDPQALQCLQHWAQRDLPLVVTRQPRGWSGRQADEALMLGLAAPTRWDRRRLCIEARVGDVRRSGHFPRASAITAMLPAPTHQAWAALCSALDQAGALARVYGSYGWQQRTGQACLRDGSDIDLLVAVDSPRQADAVIARLEHVPFGAPRLDGELLFIDGSAVAWREWAAWRAGGTEQLLVKRVHGATLENGSSWKLAARAPHGRPKALGTAARSAKVCQ